jgi:glycosyltransferase involved in cell wall biosynthesis
MRLAWCTPFSAHSDIGAHSRCIVEALPEGVKENACVFVDGDPGLALYPTTLPCISLTDGFDPRIFDLFDHTILNIGNNERNHRRINQLALSGRAVVVVHDIIMQHYLAWLCFEQNKAPAVYAELMAHHGGGEGLNILEQSDIAAAGRAPRFAPWDSDHAMAVPLIEPFLRTARAIVVHSAFAEAMVRTRADAPIIRLFLPSDKKPAPAPPAPVHRDTRVTFAAIGHIGRAKQLHLAIDAFAQSRMLRDLATLIIAGAPGDRGYASELERAVADHGLAQVVRFDYDVSEQRLLDVKQRAEVFINIRFPHAESASGSLTEQMAAARPVIVKDSGCYEELPDNTVMKIASIDDHQALMGAMERLCHDAALRRQLGADAASHVRAQTGAAYGRLLVDALGGLAPSSAGRQRQRDRHWLAETDWRMPAVPAWLDQSAERVGRLFGMLQCRTTDGIFDRDRVIMAFQPFDRLERVRIVSRYRGWLALLDREQTIDPYDLDERLDGVVFELMLALDEDRFITLVHRLVFARKPLPDELRHWRCGLDSASERAALVDVCLGSPEYAARRISSAGTETLRRTLQAGASPGVRPAPVPWLPRIVFGGDEANAAPLLFGQWHAQEMEGRWMGSVEGGLRVALPGQLAPHDQLHLAVRVAGVAKTGPRSCRVHVGDRVVLEHVFVDDERTVLPIPLSGATKSSTLVLHVVLSASVNLSAFGDEDQRDLAMFFYEAIHKRQAPEPPLPIRRNQFRIRPPKTGVHRPLSE